MTLIKIETTEKELSVTEHKYKRKANVRVHYMDYLRAYAMLLGIVFHAALAYSPLSHNVWLSADTQQSAMIDFFAWCVHLFRMPLFFLIAGYFAFYLIEKRGIKGMVRNRAKRILLPLLLFLPLLMAAMFFVLGGAAQMVEHPGPMLESITQIMNDPEAQAAQGPIRTMHLWFLYVLLYMYALAALFFKTKAVDSISEWMNKNPLLFLGVSPLLVSLMLITTIKPYPSPETFAPELWSLGFYGFFFLLGCCIFKNSVFVEKLEEYWKTLLTIGLIAYAGFYVLLPKPISLVEGISGTVHVSVTFLQGATSLLEGIRDISCRTTLTVQILFPNDEHG
ncbi:MAG: acyltransferase family protein [Bacteroidota bacterium]